MEIRYLEPGDMPQVNRIYETYFSDMEYPEFVTFHCCFVVVEYGRIVCFGGLRPMVEAVVLTDKKFSVRKRREALLNIHTALTYCAEKMDYKRIHAFAFEDKYIDHLVKRMNFKPVENSKLLILELKDGQEERTRTYTTAYRNT